MSYRTVALIEGPKGAGPRRLGVMVVGLVRTCSVPLHDGGRCAFNHSLVKVLIDGEDTPRDVDVSRLKR